jgi:uncharacterized protein YjbI with pentapeptide repeats
MIEIKHKLTGAVLRTVDADSLVGANLYGANLDGADLRRANLGGADLEVAYLEGANLEGASLRRANLRGAYLVGAYLEGAYLVGASLVGANLRGAVMPDGRVFEAYRLDPLAGICDAPEARERAVAAWGNHDWTSCPMHAAHGYTRVSDAPEVQRLAVAAFVALFDARLLPKPGGDS